MCVKTDPGAESVSSSPGTEASCVVCSYSGVGAGALYMIA